MMAKGKCVLPAVMGMLAALMVGCDGQKGRPLAPAVELDTASVLERINANNSLIANVWSRVDIAVRTPDEKHSISGHLILRKPAQHDQPPTDLLLKGGDSMGAADFQLGSNSDGYWYILDAPGSDNDVYSFVPYGQKSSGPASQALDVLSVLGVYELPARMDREPWPVCRGYDEPAYYVISFVERLADGSLRAKKDVWWNRRAQRVDLIELFDRQGNRYLSAALDDYRRFGPAEMATKLHIVWFQEKITLDLKLKDVQVNSEKVSDKNFSHRKPDWAPGDR